MCVEVGAGVGVEVGVEVSARLVYFGKHTHVQFPTMAARAFATVQIHVPTIVASTYDRKGKIQGNQMAQLPNSLGTQENEFVSWQATTPYYIPCQMYGSSILDIDQQH